MTATSESGVRIVSFGDLGGGPWGTAVDAGQPAAVFGAGSATGAAGGADALRFSSRDGEWELAGDSLQLVITPAEPGGESIAASGSATRGPAAVGELCRARGRVVLDGAQTTVDCPATRSDSSVLDRADLDSIRGIWGWFEEQRALALLAFRPRGGSGQEGDRLTATLFDPDQAIDVDEPRLSTTYTADGLPSRASLELWIGEGEEQYPRRAAAESLGTGAGVSAAGLSLYASPLRCHSQGLDGPGVYLLARF
ncbi:MAG TPA: hypothetical protein VGL51_06935 [Solirubrobacteraceae bacterium]|jgi:hypothetical protein